MKPIFLAGQQRVGQESVGLCGDGRRVGGVLMPSPERLTTIWQTSGENRQHFAYDRRNGHGDSVLHGVDEDEAIDDEKDDQDGQEELASTTQLPMATATHDEAVEDGGYQHCIFDRRGSDEPQSYGDTAEQV